MARDPGSLWQPLVEWNDQGSYTKTQLIYHSTGTRASAAANYAYFGRRDVAVESTFIVGLGPADPTLQIMDSSARADANLTANARAISVELVGTGDDPYTDWQIAEAIRIGRWAVATHPIPKRIIPAHDQGGLGWHTMFGAPGPWTSVRGKVCPGGTRIDQLKTTVFPAVFGASPRKGLFMHLTEKEEREILAYVREHRLGIPGKRFPGPAVQPHAARLARVEALLKAVAAKQLTAEQVADALLDEVEVDLVVSPKA